MEKDIDSKYLLTVSEASKYFGIGMQKIRKIIEDYDTKCGLYNGNKLMIKRKKFEDFLDKLETI